MTKVLLMELEDVNCWTPAEAVGRPGPHRLQHLQAWGCASRRLRRVAHPNPH